MRSVLIGVFSLLFLAACSSQQLLNSATPSRGYKVATNIVYDSRLNLLLDVYTPGDARNAPIVIFFHGDRWSFGSKDQYKYVGEALASKGFVGVLADFRQYPQVRFPAFVEDAARAVEWSVANAGTYGGDPAKLFVMGHSSGAHIAAMLAMKDDFLKAAGGSRAQLRGMIGLAGAYDFLPITEPDLRDLFAPPEKYEETQPVLYADGTNPPLLLMHGEDDDVVWVKNTRTFATEVKKSHGPVETVIYPKMSHGRIVQSLAKPLRGSTDVLDYVAEFVTKWAAHPYVAPNVTEESIQSTPIEIE